ncbi:carbohydrate deacetylase [Sebaldella sp. S0638]|uniref:carbohydrate deacetylase n=1 Tax=Sebaldella sp. S0638 TaxID=2957809 RepID=UPI00209F05CE|nr:carbohydrate deacetylase [Sebaldella sp. S0638]MCP1224104.1 carbohydrate deacetylase [Sebaldella sp. S0638]
MGKIVINADDFGYSKAINLGIIETHRNGILTSATMMANMYGFDHGIELMKENPKLGIGAHLTLTCGKPILDNVDSLTDNNGNFKSLKTYKENSDTADLDQLYEEWSAQISRLLLAGVRLTHLDSHHYVHSFEKHCKVSEALAKKYDLPLRNCFDIEKNITDKNILKTDIFWNLFNFPEMKKMDFSYEYIKQDLHKIIRENAEIYQKYMSVEGSCHPGYIDSQIYFGSSFNLARMREVEMLCDPDIDNILREHGFEYCKYSDL